MGTDSAGGRRAFAGAIALVIVVMTAPGRVPAAEHRVVIPADGSLAPAARDRVSMSVFAVDPVPGVAPSASTATAGGAYESNPPQQPASFASTTGDGSVAPASPSGAVGANHVVTVTEQQIRVQTRGGVTLTAVGLDAWWAALGAPDAFAPRAIYDPLRGRFILAALANPGGAASSVLMAVSATGDPTGSWYRSRFEADGDRDLYWANAPSLGFNDSWITVQAHMLRIGSTTSFSRLFFWDRADTYDGGNNRVRYGDLFGFGPSQAPAITLDAGVATHDLLMNWRGNSGGTGSLRMMRVSGAVDAPAITDLGTIPHGQLWADVWPGAVLPQTGTAAKIHAGDARLTSVVRRGGSLWAAQTAFVPAAAPTRAVAQWWRIDATNASVQQFGRVDGAAAGEHYAYPSIAPNANGDALLGFSRFSPSRHPSAAATFRYASDPPGRMRTPSVVKDGEAPYDDGSNLWGPWSAVQADPSNPSDLWTVQPYAAPANRWAVWWAQVRPMPGPSLHADSPLDFGEQRTATPSALRTLTVLNDGQHDTIVGTITMSGVNASDFAVAGNGCTGQTLLAGATCPVTVRFTPAVDGARTATLSIASTDPAGPDDVTLTGRGVPPVPAFKATPASLGFGPVVVGSSDQRTFTVSNADAATLEIAGVSMSGTHAADYVVVGDGCTGASLAPTQTCSMIVAFTPAQSGVRSAMVRFVHNAPGGSSDVALSGTGVQPGGEPRISLTPSPIWFPATEPGGETTVDVRVYNIGTGTLTPGASSILGQAVLRVATDECDGAAIESGAFCVVRVAFAPAVFGTTTATLRVPANVPGGDARASINATAVDATAPVSTFTTEQDEIVVGGGGAALTDYNVVRGATNDRLSPILRVTVTFRSSLNDAAVVARLSCDPTGRECIWTAAAPQFPGFYTVTAEAIDTWGNREMPGAPLRILVL